MKQNVSKLYQIISVAIVSMLLALVPLALMQSSASAATLSDGTWTQGGAPGTTTITFDTSATGLAIGDTVVLTFPSAEATVNAAGTNITMTGQTAPARANDGTNNTITITTDAVVAGATTVTITMTDALTAYTTTTFAQQSVAININSGGTLQDIGLAIITNDNTTTVTANVPIFLTLAIDTTTINLGTLSSASVTELDQTYTLNTNNPTGATLYLQGEANGLDDGGGNDINDVADGTVTAGSEEYGIFVDNVASLTQTAPFDAGDDAIPHLAATQFATTAAAVTNATIDFNYRASIDAATVPGAYDEVVTVTVVANP